MEVTRAVVVLAFCELSLRSVRASLSGFHPHSLEAVARTALSVAAVGRDWVGGWT